MCWPRQVFGRSCGSALEDVFQIAEIETRNSFLFACPQFASELAHKEMVVGFKRKEVGWNGSPPKWESGSELSIAAPWRVPKLQRRLFEPEPPT
jgi:hypothetical protein